MSTCLSEKTVIGWTEYVDLPEWGIRGLRAKVDTGARTSALHVEEIEELPRGRVGFFVVLNRKSKKRAWVEARVVRRGRVRSSGGTASIRAFVRTRMRLGTVEQPIELSLVDRGDMLFRMLLGREALAGTFLVDASRRRLLSDRQRKKVAQALKKPKKS